jgi:hypothetical protein
VFTFGNDLTFEQEYGYLALFDALASINANHSTRANGMKIAFSDWKKAELFVNTLNKYFPKIKIIWVKRDNLLSQYGSFKKAQKTGQHHSWIKPKKDLKKLYLNPLLFKKYLIECFKIYEQFEKLDSVHDVYIYSYEKDIMNNNYNELFEFLSLPKLEPKWLNSKKVSPKPSKYISNYKQLNKIYQNLNKHSHFYLYNYSKLEKLYFLVYDLYKKQKHKIKKIIKILFNE